LWLRGGVGCAVLQVIARTFFAGVLVILPVLTATAGGLSVDYTGGQRGNLSR